MSAVWDKIKVAAKWVYDWVTVLVAIILGALSVAIDYLDQLAGIDLTQIMSQRRAAEITLGVAVSKAAVAIYNSQKAKT